MPIDPVKIPQNVQIEDRIVGPLTLRQLIILMAGGGFSYMLYATLQKTYGQLSIPVTVMVWIPFALAGLFALVRVNDLSLTRICFLLAERVQKPSVRTWGPRRGISINIRVGSATTKHADPSAHQTPAPATDQIAQLSSVVDRTLPVREEGEIEEPTFATPAPHAPQDTTARPPVDPHQITADGAAPKKPVEPQTPNLSDLSVFRDIFPHNS